MSVTRAVLLRMFGRPRGALGRLGGMIMARTNAGPGLWVVDLLDIGSADHVLEVGFGPGVIIRRLLELATDGRVAGVDPSPEMLEQARARNAEAIGSGRADLRLGFAGSLPFGSGTFDKALAINSMQVWPDPAAGLQELHRVLQPGGRLALGFTPYSGQAKTGVADMVGAAGFTEASLAEGDRGFCLLARRR